MCNQAGYEVLLVGLRLAKEVSARRVQCRSDSKVAAKQINKVFQIQDPQLLKYYYEFERLKEEFK